MEVNKSNLNYIIFHITKYIASKPTPFEYLNEYLQKSRQHIYLKGT